MAICKHNSSKNGFAAPLEYLTMQHDEKGHLLRDGEGIPLPREQYIVDGINCLPETFAPLCLQDRIQFKKSVNRKTVDTHQYIISFAPCDIRKGLTMEEAHRFGYAFAKTNFPGHRILVCTHPDGGHHSGNIHVHIVVSSLRFQTRQPDPQFMRLGADGHVRPSEYLAGCAHQDTAVFRKHLLAQVNSYCAFRGYTQCPETAKAKVSEKEYLLHRRGIDTRHDQLRRAIADAAANASDWDSFSRKLSTGYTHTVPLVTPIPYALRQKLWTDYKELTGSFRKWDTVLRTSLNQQIDDAFRELRSCTGKAAKSAVREKIARLKQEKKQEQLFRQTFQTYSKAASAALRSRNQEDALLCLEQLQELALRQNGWWQEGFDRNSGSYSLLDGHAKSKITWKQTTSAELEIAQRLLHAVQEEAAQRKSLSSEVREVPMPIEVKLSRGEISFRHPDCERWVRGKRLGEAFTLTALDISPPPTLSRERNQPAIRMEYSR